MMPPRPVADAGVSSHSDSAPMTSFHSRGRSMPKRQNENRNRTLIAPLFRREVKQVASPRPERPAAFSYAIALGLAAVVVLAVGLRAAAAEAADDALFRAIYQELVEINTTDSSGDTVRAAEAMAAHLRAAGLPAQDLRSIPSPPRTAT